jgi:hypothetical protein
MSGQTELSPIVADLMSLVEETDIIQAELWIPEFKKGIPAVDVFYGAALTPERVKWVLYCLETVISRSLVLPLLAHDSSSFGEVLWAGHSLMDQARQKALVFGIDVSRVVVA